MKYRYINPEVIVTKIKKEYLDKRSSDQPMGKDNRRQPKEGDYLVIHPDESVELLTEKELAAKFKPSIPPPDIKREMFRLCTEIIDQEALIDEDNAEELLLHAVEKAHELRKLII